MTAVELPVERPVEDPIETLLVEQARAVARELRAAAKGAQRGKVLAVAEAVALERGREFIRKSLEVVLAEQAAEAEKKGLPTEPAAAAIDATKAPIDASS